MSIYLDNNLAAAHEVPQTEATETTKARNISYRANPDNSLERNPEQDTYKKSSTGKKIGIAASALALIALIAGGILYHKGGAEGVEKTIGQRIKDGWKEVCSAFSKNKNVATEEVEAEIVAATEGAAESTAKAGEEATAKAEEIVSGAVEIIS